ncbi:MAG TPA: pyridoxal-dependent decarboxylase, partial [Candidatus Limnocylindria bacterium]
MDERTRALRRAAELSEAFLDGLPERHVGATVDGNTLAARIGGPLPEDGQDAAEVVEEMARVLDPGLVATAGPRYFGFVIGGALPASVAADWLAAAWDQNANLHSMSPAAAAVESVAAEWLLDLLGLPADASVGFPAGAGLANAVSLAAARHAVLAREGWDVEARGLYGAPEIAVVLGAEAHATVQTALQYLGLGRERVVAVAADGQGRMRVDALV